MNEKLRRDPSFRLANCLRVRRRTALTAQNARKNFKSNDLLGISIAEYVNYLEEKFQEGMSWENYGSVWSVDEIKPCAAFDLTDPEQQKSCFHYTNTQPLFCSENISKGSLYQGKRHYHKKNI